MSVDTPKWNENNSSYEITETNIIEAKRFAETVKLYDLQENEFNALKKVLDNISLQNWEIALENREQKWDILNKFNKELNKELKTDENLSNLNKNSINYLNEVEVRGRNYISQIWNSNKKVLRLHWITEENLLEFIRKILILLIILRVLI